LLAVSRSIGDAAAKDGEGPPEAQAVTCCPDVFEFKANGGDVLVLACDGVWDVLSNDEVATIVQQSLKESSSRSMDDVAESIVKAAYDGGSSDNISVVCARFD
jgi:serine/threonine protein phosphatase PrpC